VQTLQSSHPTTTTAPSTATPPNFSAPDASTASPRDSVSASTFPPTHLAPPLAQLPTYRPDSERAPRSQDNALQQQGIPATPRGRAQLQATASSSTPEGRWNNRVAGGTAAFDDDNGGRKERIKDAGGDVRSPFYTDFDKLAYASNNNSYQNPGNEPRLLDSCALGNSGNRPDIDSNDDTNQHNNSNNSSNTNTTTTTTTTTSNIDSNDIDSEANVHTFKKNIRKFSTTSTTPLTAATPFQSNSRPMTRRPRLMKMLNASTAICYLGVLPLAYLATRSPVLSAELTASSLPADGSVIESQQQRHRHEQLLVKQIPTPGPGPQQ